MSKSITKLDDFNDLLLNNKYVIADFYAEWCGPCKQIAPLFEKMAKKYGDKIKFCKIDIEKAQEIAEICNISSMPTFRIYQDAKNIDKIVGADMKRLLDIVKNLSF